MSGPRLASRLSRLAHQLCSSSSRHVLTSRRALTAPTSSLGTQFDVRIFVEPVVDREKLEQPLDPTDDRNFLYPKPMKFDESPVFYRDHVVDKLVRVCLMEGRKETSRKNILEALELIKRRQYARKKVQRPEDTEKIELNPFVIANTAIQNCVPLMKLLNVTRGGTTYRVPFPIQPHEAEFRAMKSMRDICRKRAFHGETTFAEALASELLAAARNEGATIAAKQEHHKLCDANRAFAHYRR